MFEVKNLNKVKLMNLDDGYEILFDSKKIENLYIDIICE